MYKFKEPILVTRPYFPPIEDFVEGCKEIWCNQWLSNDGPMVKKFHSALAEYYSIAETNIALFCNGTMALELGCYAMGLQGGDVITSPFTFVATSHALKRIGATPFFADIDPRTLCLDPEKCEKLITNRTKAILPVHVYGNACDTVGFQRLSEKYGVKIIYDAAHAFGIKEFAGAGDMCMYSFHPTKLFHSCEGGMLVFKDDKLQRKLFELRNFAIQNELNCNDVGANAKMNELQALMGLKCLKQIDRLLDYRRQIRAVYADIFKDCCSVRLVDCSFNDSYIPVLFEDFETRERIYYLLKECNVYARRYFYPLLTDFSPYAYAKGSCPIAQDVSLRVLTLPTYYGLPLESVAKIAKIICNAVS